MAARDHQNIRQHLLDIIEHLDHVLPGQAPIKDFVHHNTLHGYQHMLFPDALKAAYETTGNYGYMSQQEFVEYFEEGRITQSDILHVVDEDDALKGDTLWYQGNDCKIRHADLIYTAMHYGKEGISASKLNWLIEEKNVLSKVRDGCSERSRKRLCQSAKNESEAISHLWRSCLDVLNIEHDQLHPEDVAELTPELAEQLFRGMTEPSQGSIDPFVLHGAIRKASDHIREQLWGELGETLTLRGLLKKLTGHDILTDYRPALLRHIASFLDQGVASWHQNDRNLGFFASWKASAAQDMVSHDPELPDWKDELESLPDNSLDAVIWELDHLGLDKKQWAKYLERVALELGGWSGMFLWLHNNPNYEGMEQPVNMMDYLAVRLVLERLYAQRLTRLQWKIEASLFSLHGYFHRCRSELFVRYQLYQGSLPEFLVNRANRLSNHGASFADDYQYWQQLADMIYTWQQGDRLQGHEHYTVHQHAWPLFQSMQILGLDAERVAAFSEKQIQSYFDISAMLDENTMGFLWLKAYEHHYREQFFNAISRNTARGTWKHRYHRPDAQILFCMDDREEGVRRHLEALNPAIETLGTAAHFNVPHRWKGLDDNESIQLTPVTIDPVHEIHEKVITKDKDKLSRHHQGVTLRADLADLLNQEVRRNLLSSSIVIALSAPMTLLTLLGKVFVPRFTGRWLKRFNNKVDTSVETEIEITLDQTKEDATPQDPAFGYSIEEQVTRIRAFLRTNGLASGFGRFVVIMGHGSTNENNPHRSAYGCGACSGKYSGPNARIVAKMANNPTVRAALAEQDIVIPDDCWFMGAMHNTCSELIDWYDVRLIPSDLDKDFKQLQNELIQACELSAHERCRKFASAPVMPDLQRALKHIQGRALDFSQARPELGHATNACAVIGRRSASQGVFFDRRIFLISYDARVDDERGTLLEALLLSAGPVGAGISLEYYFSKVCNDGYGAGSKVTHNVAGFFGVMEGAGSDLRTGLPKQMIEIHEAMRLQVMVEASVEVLTNIYQRAPALQELIGNGWIIVSSLDPDTGEIHAFNPDKGFTPWSNYRLPKLSEVKKSVDWYVGKMEPLKPVLITKTDNNSTSRENADA
ncbi:MAG: DUF2309 domain-containing protein [Thiotrichaceae bacterium]|nr:DUF2309 domain-containing protein [Thiotrichaceae bacterium]